LIVRLRQSKFRGNVEIDGEEEKPESDDWTPIVAGGSKEVVG